MKKWTVLFAPLFEGEIGFMEHVEAESAAAADWVAREQVERGLSAAVKEELGPFDAELLERLAVFEGHHADVALVEYAQFMTDWVKLRDLRRAVM